MLLRNGVNEGIDGGRKGLKSLAGELAGITITIKEAYGVRYPKCSETKCNSMDCCVSGRRDGQCSFWWSEDRDGDGDGEDGVEFLGFCGTIN